MPSDPGDPIFVDFGIPDVFSCSVKPVPEKTGVDVCQVEDACVGVLVKHRPRLDLVLTSLFGVGDGVALDHHQDGEEDFLNLLDLMVEGKCGLVFRFCPLDGCVTHVFTSMRESERQAVVLPHLGVWLLPIKRKPPGTEVPEGKNFFFVCCVRLPCGSSCGCDACSRT